MGAQVNIRVEVGMWRPEAAKWYQTGDNCGTNDEGSREMAQDPGIGQKVTATVTGVKGSCSAGHQDGDTFGISCHNPDGLCGFFYHDIFPNLSIFQFGGNLPWWQGDTIEVQCPDSYNLVTLRLERSPRD
jgi:uncharacterized repeat protein (TIGR04076 family)